MHGSQPRFDDRERPPPKCIRLSDRSQSVVRPGDAHRLLTGLFGDSYGFEKGGGSFRESASPPEVSTLEQQPLQFIDLSGRTCCRGADKQHDCGQPLEAHVFASNSEA